MEQVKIEGITSNVWVW